MKRIQKVCALLFGCMILLLQACGSAGQIKGDGPQTTFTPGPELTPTIIPTSGEITLAPGSTIELQIYTMNTDTLQLEAATALVPADSALTPELVVEAVLDAMADAAYFVEIAGITEQDETITVDFYKEGPPVTNVGGAVEAVILDAIGQSLLDNLEAYNKVSYTIEGGAYRTGHLELSLGESYIER